MNQDLFKDNDHSNHFNLNKGDVVELRIVSVSEMGFAVMINNSEEGLLYHNEVFEPIAPGDIKTGYIKLIRDDGKIDVSLQQQGYGNIENTKYVVLSHLDENAGVLKLGDKSNPEDIYRELHMSKKTFKKAIGALYKQKLIAITDYEIRRIN